MKALTIWQPWASLIMAGAKPFEWRGWPAPRFVVGQRIAIHAGARKPLRDEIADLVLQLQRDAPGTALVKAIALPLLEAWLPAPGMLPLSSVLGTAIIGPPRRATDLLAAGRIVADSDRVSHGIWGWPLTDIQTLHPYVPARGAQGFWDWTPPADPDAPAAAP